jgi:NTP pyrophosphatase (non-canonical NTP hydrolase)
MLSILRQANETRQKEWDPNNNITIEYRGNELAGEVGEACNLIKKLARERLGLRGTRTNNYELAKELADIIICVDLIAMQLGFELNYAIKQKFNETSSKYGLKTII